MNQDGVNHGRRRVLFSATAAVGAVGVVGVAIPFVASWTPSEKAKAIGAPVKADVGKLAPGEMTIIEWRGKPIFVVNRPKEMIEALKADSLRARLSDPDSAVEQQPSYAGGELRSIQDQYLVIEGVCTHLGCSPKFVPEVEPQGFDEKWQGGFFCPCHGSRFDLAGRVFKGVPAPTNLRVPPHYFDGTVLIIGEEGESA